MNAPVRHTPGAGLRLRVLSLGAGVQSTTLALMAAHGEIGPMPDCAIFADTGAEPEAVYAHLRWLMSPGVLPFPVHMVSAGNLRDEILGAADGTSRNDARPPWYIRNSDGSKGILRRQCTQDYKILPIQKRVRDLLGLQPRQRWPKERVVEKWIGISLDEAIRMKPSWTSAIENRWPLIELRMNRRDCLAWLDSHGYPLPPKSACTFCPFRRDAEWRRMRDEAPEEFADAVAIDHAIRAPGHGRRRGEAFIHQSLKPLDQVDLSTAAERGQPDLFLNECEGMCGV